LHFERNAKTAASGAEETTGTSIALKEGKIHIGCVDLCKAIAEPCHVAWKGEATFLIVFGEING
jgi:hypothetical protein